MTRLSLVSDVPDFSRLPPCSIQLLVGVHSKAEIVATSVGDVVGDTSDLADDDEVVSLGLFIDSPVKREGVDEVVVDARGLGAVDPREFYHGGDGALAILAHTTQRLESGLDERGDHLGLLLDEPVGSRKRSPGIFYFVAVIKEIFHALIQADITELRTYKGAVRHPRHQCRQLIFQSRIDIDHILVAIESVLGKDLFEHEGGDGGYTRGRDFLSLQLFRARDIRLAQQPLVHPIVDGQCHLQGRVASGEHDQRAGAGDGKVNAPRHQGLDARRRLDESDLEVYPFLLHVAPVQSDGINQMLKALARYREVYGLRHQGLSVEKKKNHKKQYYSKYHNLFHGTSSFLNEEIERNGLGLSQRIFFVKPLATRSLRIPPGRTFLASNFPLTIRRVLSNLV